MDPTEQKSIDKIKVTVDGACSGRLGREAGGVHKLEVEVGGLRRESLGKIKVGDEVGG